MQHGPVLVNIMTNADSLAMPTKVEWEQVKESYALSMTKLILGGGMDEVMDSLTSNDKHVKELI